MRITAYIHPWRTAITPTGVGNHIIQMVAGLAREPGIDVKLLTSRRELTEGRIDARSPLTNLPALGHPLSRTLMERLWFLTGHPKADRWAGHADWIYCPAEAFVPANKAALAVTVHDTYLLEPDLPWSNTPRHKRARWRAEMMFKPIRRHAKLILAVSEFTKSRLVTLLDFDPAQIAVVGNGVDEIYFADPADDKAPDAEDLPKGPYLYVVGGLSRKKGASYLLATARKLADAAPSMRIIVSGLTEAIFEDEAKKLGNLIRVGYIPLPRQVKMMRGALAVMILSRLEGFGMPALEGMAAGAPAIVSGFASLPEVVGDAGLIVNVERPDLIVESILRLQNDTNFRQELILKGRQRAAQFHWSAAVSKLVAALKAAS